MAVRIRKNGQILCAAMHRAEPGDFYLNDEIHYYLSVTKKILVTEPWEKHQKHGEWWFKTSIPQNIEIEKFYITDLVKKT